MAGGALYRRRNTVRHSCRGRSCAAACRSDAAPPPPMPGVTALDDRLRAHVGNIAGEIGGRGARTGASRASHAVGPDRVFFVDEEPPYFQGPEMGSHVYAVRQVRTSRRWCRPRPSDTTARRRAASGIHFLATLGYPDTRSIIVFVANTGARALLHRAIADFRDATIRQPVSRARESLGCGRRTRLTTMRSLASHSACRR